MAVVTVACLLLGSTLQADSTLSERPRQSFRFAAIHAAATSPASESERIVNHLRLNETVAGWGPVEIGMTVAQLSALSGSPIAIELRGEHGLCDHGASVQLDGRTVSITLSGNEPTATVEGFFIPVQLSSRSELVSALKRKFPTLEYRPSRHDPEVPEGKNPIPFYLFPTNPRIGILVRPSGGPPPAGLYVSLLGCFE